MADNSIQGGTDTIRDKDRAGVKTQIYGVDLNIGGASEVLQTAAALADTTANPTIPAWASMGMVFNGTTWDRMRGDTTNGVDVDVTRLPALPAGAALIGKVDINTAPQVAVNNVETLTDNAAFTDGTSKVFPQGYIFDEVAGTALTENDVAAGRVNANRAVVTVTEDGATRGRYATVKAASTAAAATDPAQVVSLSPNSPVTPPTLTKGTQGATGISTQDLKDAGRVVISWTIFSFATTAAAETLLTVTESRDGATVTTFTSKVITSGKRLRLQSVHLVGTTGGTTPAISRLAVRIRVNTAGAVTAASTSPVQWIGGVGIPATVKSVSDTLFHDWPDGLEFAGNGTTQIGVTVESPDWVTTTNLPQIYTLTITGYEY